MTASTTSSRSATGGSRASTTTPSARPHSRRLGWSRRDEGGVARALRGFGRRERLSRGEGSVPGGVGGRPRRLQRAIELDPSDIGALYSSAFLLEREGRSADAAHAWGAILD